MGVAESRAFVIICSRFVYLHAKYETFIHNRHCTVAVQCRGHNGMFKPFSALPLPCSGMQSFISNSIMWDCVAQGMMGREGDRR